MGLKPRITKEQEAWENSPRNKENWTSWNKLQEDIQTNSKPYTNPKRGNK